MIIRSPRIIYTWVFFLREIMLKIKQSIQELKDKAAIVLAIITVVVLFVSYIIWVDIQSTIKDYKK